MNKSFIWVTFQKEGTHCYPEAAKDPNLKDVNFLGYPHRHIFHFKVWIEVFQDNRDIEFIQFKRWLESLYNENTLNLNSKSCEMISNDLYDIIKTKYPNRDIKISISEDNENGSEIYYDVEKLGTTETSVSNISTSKEQEPQDNTVNPNIENNSQKEKLDLSNISFDHIAIIKGISDTIADVKQNPSGTMQNIITKFVDNIKSN